MDALKNRKIYFENRIWCLHVNLKSFSIFRRFFQIPFQAIINFLVFMSKIDY